MKHFFLIACCLTACLVVNSTALAQNLIFNNYATGTNINGLWGGQPDPDDQVVTRALGGTFSFFGVNHTTADISTNGNINFVSGNFIPGGGLPSSLPVGMYVLGDDLRSYSAIPTAAYELTGANFYSMTYENIGQFGQSTSRQNTMQIAWFNGSVTVGTFNFQAGDIAFDYTKISGAFRDGDAMVGLNNQSSAAVLPSTGNGVITDATAPSLLPIDDDRFVLFRVNGSGGYDASTQSLTAAVPEPSTLAFIGAGVMAGGLGIHRWSKKRRRCKRQR